MAEDETRHVVTLHGDLDFSSAPAARELLLGNIERDRELCVDMSEVSYVDSAGVACLLETKSAADAEGGSFSLTHLSDSVMRTLSYARLETVFTILDPGPRGG